MSKPKVVVSESLKEKYGHLQDADSENDLRVLPEDEGKVSIVKEEDDTYYVKKLLHD